MARLESFQHVTHVGQRHYLAIGAGLTVRAAIDHGFGGDVRNKLGNPVKRVKIVGGDGGAGLDLDSPNAEAGLIQQVALQTPCVSEEGKVGPPSLVEAALEGFHDDQVLEERSAKGMSDDLLRVFNTDKIAGQPNVVEVELGRFDQALSDVGVKGRQLER